MKDVLNKFDTLHFFIKKLAEGFRPSADIYLKKSEGRTLLQIKMNEGKPMKYYCEKMDMENGSFTYLADKLEEKGCIKRVTLKSDRRVKGLYLTEEGHRISAEVDQQFERHIESKLENLSKEDLVVLDSFLEKLPPMIDKLKRTQETGK